LENNEHELNLASRTSSNVSEPASIGQPYQAKPRYGEGAPHSLRIANTVD
jgi:hypothetical protein